VLARKLELLKTDLRRWNEDAVGNIERKKKSFLERLCVFDVIEEERAFGAKELMK
jgi:hypothetical protein